ncbi:G-alpha-domain-containing protein [Flagelloscypha sp. PMI_526]|nr:G-alpha-domain-containing protein [Flagelloscypha sp. PMI_526]
MSLRSRSKSRERTRSRAPSPDPFDMALLPPKNETKEDKAAREAQEERARQISRAIDNELKAEKAALKKEGTPIKILILGQSYSGKSTTLKNIQMQYGRDQWEQERSTWKIVILLNLLRGANTILDALAAPTIKHAAALSVETNTKFEAYQSRLSSLKALQSVLEKKLGAAAREVGENDPGLTPSEVAKRSPDLQGPQEFSVPSNMGWKRVLNLKRRKSKSNFSELPPMIPLETFQAIAQHADDITLMWQDLDVQALIQSGDIILEDSSSHFIQNIKRVTADDFDPNDEDVLRARLRTTGIQEYRFKGIGRKSDPDWAFYDFNGSRSSRSAWFSYFDDAKAVLFLASLDCYDETDSDGVNRLQDSLLLWRALCSNKLLAKVQSLILLLNKCDLLEQKLQRSNAPQVSDYFKNYKKTNDAKSVQTFFRTYFQQIHSQYSPEPREFICHYISAINTQSTALTLRAVKDVILMQYLESANLIQ